MSSIPLGSSVSLSSLSSLEGGAAAIGSQVRGNECPFARSLVAFTCDAYGMLVTRDVTQRCWRRKTLSSRCWSCKLM